jgi:hypothetical protein
MTEDHAGGAERRVHPRYPVMWSATVTAATPLERYVLNCRIKNISISGLHVLAEKELEAGRDVTLRIDRVGSFQGRVVWSDGNRLGIRFTESPERIAELIKDQVPLAEP